MRRLLILSVGTLFLLTACSGDTTASEPDVVDACTAADPALMSSLNDTLSNYEKGETVSQGTSAPVDMPGAGTMRWDVLVAAQLDKANQPGLWAFNSASGFVVPLNAAAIAAMPDASADNTAAIANALNSTEGMAAVACVS
jgi:hypothetical protein